ncbi:hypothetical protein [Paraburkholderia caballeronis]|uniref:Uncharacterized protein n=1 Tax=Paraburkholderia caballeronis TaxID=416943 RepID=A0A1H7VG83_9BURK|nr:hypothetical protein [Paraburkholderia caballeronis]PXW16945.1 hypothetical protein C7403_12077 [Paraburkholderia caballeronis]PXW94607.1 hypothetical protein C7407_1203 [Paraburkholderia caballeronis]RAJ90002.1 hypothetical protein C7409_12077 [Paraburkholderia caballeronis]SEB58096.1 hypothetical protein SAMN05445871_0629 [Paraburkholderia caballeronis]SEM07828.1 hypothetical protein SAMN05192542_12460 [Paraburkholderia caballeronis]
MSLPATKQEPFAYCYGYSEYGFGKIVIELRNYLINAFGDVYMGDIRIRCSFSDQFEDAYAFEIEYHSHIGARLNELRAAARKMAAIKRKLTSCNALMGHTNNFPEYARRVLAAAGISRLHVDQRFRLPGESLSVNALPTYDTADDDAVRNAIGSLVQEGLKQYAKQPTQGDA